MADLKTGFLGISVIVIEPIKKSYQITKLVTRLSVNGDAHIFVKGNGWTEKNSAFSKIFSKDAKQ